MAGELMLSLTTEGRMNNLVAKYSGKFNHARIHRDRTKTHRASEDKHHVHDVWAEYLEERVSIPEEESSRIGTSYLGKKLIAVV